MEIQKSTMNGASEVGRFRINYTIQNDREGNPTDMSANIYCNGSVVGNYNCNISGGFGVSVTERAEASAKERRELVYQLLEDSEQIFGTEGKED